VLGIFIINAVLFTLFQLPTLLLMRRFNTSISAVLLSFALAWICFEQVHLDWAISFPVLNLGTNLLAYPALVQWYDTLGVYGGAIWCFAINISIFLLLCRWRASQDWKQLSNPALSLLLILGLPLFVSLQKWQNSLSSNQESLNILSVHPDLDCYDERQHLNAGDAIEYYFNNMSTTREKEQIDLILWPENAVTDLAWVSEINSVSNNPNVNRIKKLLQQYPNATLLTGAIVYDPPKAKSTGINVNYSEQINEHFLAYNAITAFSETEANMVRSKEKLVPFEEVFPLDFSPFTDILSLWTKVSDLDFFFSPAQNWGEKVFISQKNTTILPLICYESAFPGFLSDMHRKFRPGLITVHLNEGWYNHPRGARLFQKMAQARAIENRKAIMRSSNRGYSDFISPKGAIVQQIQDANPQNLLAQVPIMTNSSTFFVRSAQPILALLAYFFYITLFGIALVYSWPVRQIARKKTSKPTRKNVRKAAKPAIHIS
jgi:apolipoprotein N-acyltransferase